ncbi:MAG: HAD-IIB family hydrolase [Spirochaetaceae bacterium]|nr:HAD-IIB family hydrolase [Spirochaetaceae bacterium]
MKSITEMTSDEASGIRFVLTDIDDTLTTQGKLSSQAYQALWQLRDAGIKVIPITGRSAGWCDLIAREWPVEGVIGENGAFAFWEEAGMLKSIFHPQAIKNDHPILEQIKAEVFKTIPGIRLAKDQFARLFDIAFDFAEEEPRLSLEAAEHIRSIAVNAGAQAKISSIHVNIWIGHYDKVSMTEQFLSARFAWKAHTDNRQLIFVGDSPNDEPLFAHFPLTAAVATIHRYRSYLQQYPAFVTTKEGGAGFAEIARIVLESVRSVEIKEVV